MAVAEGTKHCIDCDIKLSLDNCYVRASGRFRQTCISCAKSRAKKNAEKRKLNDPLGEYLKRFERRLRRKFGMTVEQYFVIYDEQGGVCALCGEEESERDRVLLPVDHCHFSGRVRGLLCSHCNRQLGWVEAIGLERVNVYLRPRLEVVNGS